MQIIIELFIPYYYYYCWIIMFSNVNCNNSEYNNNIIYYLNVLIITINIILTISIDNVDITIHTIHYIISSSDMSFEHIFNHTAFRIANIFASFATNTNSNNMINKRIITHFSLVITSTKRIMI